VKYLSFGSVFVPSSPLSSECQNIVETLQNQFRSVSHDGGKLRKSVSFERAGQENFVAALSRNLKRFEKKND
jgi:hypothetical protein